MNTNQSTSRRDCWLIAAVVILVIFAIVKTVCGINRNVNKSIRETESQSAGWPANEAQLKVGQVYFAKGVIVDGLHDRTNYFAVIEEVTILASDSYKHSLSNRLFALRQRLDPGTYYSAIRSGTNISLSRIAPPLDNLGEVL